MGVYMPSLLKDAYSFLSTAYLRGKSLDEDMSAGVFLSHFFEFLTGES